MYKRNIKVLRVGIFFWIFYVTAIMSISYPVLKYPVKTYCTVSSDFENFSDTAYGKENKIEGYSFEREHPVEKYQVPNLVSDDDTTNIEKEVIEPSQSEGEQEPENQEVIVQEEMRNNIIGYTLPNGVRIYVLAEGRLVNLAAGDGPPSVVY